MDFENMIDGASYIGNPQNKTVMFISKKVSNLLPNLEQAQDCLVFAETGMDIPNEIFKKHHFVFSNYPQEDYAQFTRKIEQKRMKQDQKRKYKLTDGGYYIGENVSIGENSIIEPCCLIGHDVVIGKNAYIMTGTKIKNAIIGDDFIACENSVIGAYGFTVTKNGSQCNIRIPSLGKVIIGNHVEIGACNNISRGSGGNTIIEDYVKLDAVIHIAHDTHIHKNSEIAAGAIFGGFAEIDEDVFVGLNSTIRNRVSVGQGSFVGMAAAVTRSTLDKTTVVGNPAKPLKRD